jgi:hypothetical protein
MATRPFSRIRNRNFLQITGRSTLLHNSTFSFRSDMNQPDPTPEGTVMADISSPMQDRSSQRNRWSQCTGRQSCIGSPAPVHLKRKSNLPHHRPTYTEMRITFSSTVTAGYRWSLHDLVYCYSYYATRVSPPSTARSDFRSWLHPIRYRLAAPISQKLYAKSKAEARKTRDYPYSWICSYNIAAPGIIRYSLSDRAITTHGMSQCICNGIVLLMIDVSTRSNHWSVNVLSYSRLSRLSTCTVCMTFSI